MSGKAAWILLENKLDKDDFKVEQDDSIFKVKKLSI